MALGFKSNPYPAFRPGETVLQFKSRVWRLSCKSLPTYRLFFSLPPLTEAALYVTDRRIVLMANVLRLLCQEFSIWFKGRADGKNPELFKSVSTGTGHWSGQYLELISEDPQKHWCRSRELRLRFFLRNPGPLQQLIAEAVRKDR
jgi:hypothetical protein